MTEQLSSEDDGAVLVVYALIWGIVIIGAFTKWRLPGRTGVYVEVLRENVPNWSGVGRSLGASLLVGFAILTAWQAIKAFR